MEDNLPWKKTFHGRQPLMEDDLRWKTTFEGRRPLMEDDLQWKTTFDGRGPSMDDDKNKLFQENLNPIRFKVQEIWKRKDL